MDDSEEIPELPDMSRVLAPTDLHPDPILLNMDGPVPELPDMGDRIAPDSLPPPPVSVGKKTPLTSVPGLASSLLSNASDDRSERSYLGSEAYSREASEFRRAQLDAASDPGSDAIAGLEFLKLRPQEPSVADVRNCAPLNKPSPRGRVLPNLFQERASSDLSGLQCPMTGSHFAPHSNAERPPSPGGRPKLGRRQDTFETSTSGVGRPSMLRLKSTSSSKNGEAFGRSVSSVRSSTHRGRKSFHETESVVSGSRRSPSPGARSVISRVVSGTGSGGGRSSMPSTRKQMRKGGGGIIGDVQARKARRFMAKTQPPVFDEEEARKFGKLVEESWSQALDVTGYLDFGRLIYDEIFEEDIASDLHQFFEDRDPDSAAALFSNMIESMVTFASDPKGLHSKLESLAQIHLRHSVMPIHFVSFGNVLTNALLHVLGEERFTREVEEAWQWVWGISTKSYTVLHNSASSSGSLVAISWDIACDNATEEEIGQAIYDKLFQLAPHMKHMFSQPKEVMALKLVDMISVLVSFSDDEKKMIEEVTSVGMRHVKVGMKAAHIPMMGQALIETVAAVVGRDWTTEMEKGWNKLWTTTADLMQKTVEDGQLHGPVMEALWANAKKKGDARAIGGAIHSYLTQADPAIARVMGISRTHSGRKRRLSADWSINDTIHLRKLSTEGGGGEGNAPETARMGKGGGRKQRRESIVDQLVVIEMDKDGTAGNGDGANGNGKEKGHAKNGVELTSRNGDKKPALALGSKGDEESAETWGSEVWGLLGRVMETLWTPNEMNEYLLVVATRLHKQGLTYKQLPTLGKAIQSALQRLLQSPCQGCSQTDWTPNMGKAWEWCWWWISELMGRTLISLESRHAEIVRQSWELIKSKKTEDEIGDMIFKHLVLEAPNVIHLFVRPRKMQAFMFMQALEILVTFSETPETFFDELKQLSIRHIKYGVKTEYLKPFGRAVLAGIEELMAQNWDEVYKVAWHVVWRRISSCVQHSLSIGTNLITIALVNGDVERLDEALACAPRGQRVQWGLRVSLHGNVMSPLYWAIRDGKFAIAEFLIRDVLMIRADREEYYYGREQLFETHPALLSVLCTECPELVESVLDGLVWHSQLVEDGTIRTNYYIKELYGTPTEDAWKTNLAVLTLEGKPEMFMHHVVDMLLDVKFNTFGRKIFMSHLATHCVLLVLFILTFLTNHDCSDNHSVLRVITGCLAGLVLLIMMLLITRQYLRGQVVQKKAFFMGNRTYPWPHLLQNPWNVLRFVCMIGVLLVVSDDPNCHGGHARRRQQQQGWRFADFGVDFLGGSDNFDGGKHFSGPGDAEALDGRPGHWVWMPEGGGSEDERRKLGCGTAAPRDEEFPESTPLSFILVVECFTAIMMWGQLMQALVLNKSLAALTYSVAELFADVTRNLVVIMLILVSISAGLTSLQEPYFNNFGDSSLILIKLILGLGGPPVGDAMEPLGLSIVVVYVVITEIGLLSILIAQLALSYENLSVHKVGYARMNKAYVCVEGESLLPLHLRKRFYDACGFEKPLPFDNGDLGPAGGIQVLEPAYIRATPKYIPDRILRAVGEASKADPWPVADKGEDRTI